MLSERGFVDAREVAHPSEAELGELLRRRRTDAPQRSDRQHVEPLGLLCGTHPKDAGTVDEGAIDNPGLRLLGREFREEFVPSESHPTEETEFIGNATTQRRGRLQWPHVKSSKTSKVSEDLVEPERFVVRREVTHHAVKLSRVLLVTVESSGQDDQ